MSKKRRILKLKRNIREEKNIKIKKNVDCNSNVEYLLITLRFRDDILKYEK